MADPIVAQTPNQIAGAPPNADANGNSVTGNATETINGGNQGNNPNYYDPGSVAADGTVLRAPSGTAPVPVAAPIPTPANNPAPNPTTVSTPTPVSTMPAGVTPDPNSIVDTLKTMGIDSSPANIATLYKGAGFNDPYTGTAAQNTALNNYYQTGPGKPKSTGIVTSTQSQNQMTSDANTLATANASITAANDNTSSGSGTGSGSGTDTTSSPAAPVTNSDGSTTVTDSLGNTYIVPPGSDMGVVNAQLGDINDAIDTLQTDQQNVQSYLNYNVGTDPNATNAANLISDKYDILIQQAQQKATLMMRSVNAINARDGMLGNSMGTSYAASVAAPLLQQIANLTTTEADEITKSNLAYQNGNVKDLDAAQAAVKTATTAKSAAIAALSKTLDTTIAQNAAQAKEDAANLKAQQNSDFATAKVDAQQVLDNLTAAGITDPSSPDYINTLKAAAKADGISDWTILQGAVGQLNPTSGKAGLAQQNIVSTINDRNAKTQSDIEKANQTIQLNNGKIASLNLSGLTTTQQQQNANTLGKTIAASKAYVTLANNASVVQQLTALQNVSGSAAQEEALGKFASTLSATGTGVARLINYVQNNFGEKAAQTINSGLQYVTDNKTIPANVMTNMINAVQADYTAQQSSFANSVGGQIQVYANANGVSPGTAANIFAPILDPSKATTPNIPSATNPKTGQKMYYVNGAWGTQQ